MPNAQYDIFINNEWIGFAHGRTPKAAAKTKMNERGIVVTESSLNVKVYSTKTGELVYEANAQQLWTKPKVKNATRS